MRQRILEMPYRPLPTSVLLLPLLGIPRFADGLYRMIRTTCTNALPGWGLSRWAIRAA
jgi:hypothetical protein